MNYLRRLLISPRLLSDQPCVGEGGGGRIVTLLRAEFIDTSQYVFILLMIGNAHC